MALQVLIVALLTVGGLGRHIPEQYGGTHPAQYGSKTSKYTDEEPVDYGFVYGVKDRRSGQDFSHQEAREGHSVTGEYRVLLPDGRLQIVTYVADHDGYRADVSYEGKSKPSPYKPSFPPKSNKPTRPPHNPAPYKVKELYKIKAPTTTQKPKPRYTARPSRRPKTIVTTTSKPRHTQKPWRPNTAKPKASYLKPFDSSPYSPHPGPYGPSPFDYQPNPYSFSDSPYLSPYDDSSYSPYYPTDPEPYPPGPYPSGPYPPSQYTLHNYFLGKDSPATSNRAVPHEATSSLYSLLIMDDQKSAELPTEHQYVL